MTELHYKLQILVEQAVAFGRSDRWIVAHLDVTGAQVRQVRAYLAECSRHVDLTDGDARLARRTTERTA